jgi:hypothetical protein
MSRDFCITIGTYPSRVPSLAEELGLLKAGLLYADSVKLYSLQASMLSVLEKVADVPLRQQLRLLEMVAPFIVVQGN